MKKFKGIQEIPIHLGIFDYTIIVVVGKKELVESYIRKVFKDKEFIFNPETRGAFISRGSYMPRIWIEKKPKTPRDIATLTHECLHVVYAVMRWASIPINSDTEEVVCHSVAWLVTESLRKIR